MVVAAYGLLLPQWLLDWPTCAAVNIHASLLPRWRGAAPIQRAILDGDAETGISIMKVELGLDAGPVYSQSRLEIGHAETAGQLHDRLSSLGAKLLQESLPGILDGSLQPREQDENLVTYAPKITKADAQLDWTLSSAALARRVRAFNPWPICTAELDDGSRLRIHEAVEIPASSQESPGKIVSTGKDGIDVAAGHGQLRLLQIQSPGARIMSAGAYLNAHSLAGQSFVC
jgi:methionyl-tRNA formyltransferase